MGDSVGRQFISYAYLDLSIQWRLMLAQLEVGWGIATMCMSSVRSYKALYALRFLVGLFEYVGNSPSYHSIRRSLILEIDLGFTPAFIIF